MLKISINPDKKLNWSWYFEKDGYFEGGKVDVITKNGVVKVRILPYTIFYINNIQQTQKEEVGEIIEYAEIKLWG